MFDQRESKRSGAVRIGLRVLVSLGAGVLLTFLVPVVLGAVWPYFQDKNYEPYGFAIFIVRILNFPSFIYCRFFALPPGLPKSDESLYCWSVGVFFNIPYYAIVIFAFWSLVSWLNSRCGRASSPAVAN